MMDRFNRGVWASILVGLLYPGVAMGATLDGETLTGSVTIPEGTTDTVINNLTLDNADVEVRGLLEFLGTNIIDGNGRIELIQSGDIRYNRSSAIGLIPGHQLTIGSGVEVVGSRDGGPGSPSISFTSSSTFNPDRLINQGTLAAEGDPGDLNADLLVAPLLFDNRSQVVARDGGHMRLFMREGWKNTGSFLAEDGGTFTLAGTIETAELGNIQAQGNGRFILDGTLENAGQTLTLDATTGSVQLVFSQNTINGGTIKGVDGANLYSDFNNRRLNFLELNNGVTLDIDLLINSSGADVVVRDGLTVNERFFFNGDDLTFIGVGPVSGSTIDGTGLLELSDALLFTNPLFIANGMTVRGGSFAAKIASNNGTALNNLGTIEALAGDRLDIESALSQQGLIHSVDGGTIQLEGNTDNTGQIVVERHGSVRYDAGTQSGNVSATEGGVFRFFGGTNTVSGTVQATNGGIVQISAPLQNDGSITVNDGFLWLESGSITGNDAAVTDSTVVLSNAQTATALPTVPRTNSGWGLYSGELDNTTNTINLTSDPNTQWTIYGISTVTGGAFFSPDGTPLRTGHFLNSTNSTVTLDDVDVQTQTIIEPGITLNLTNGSALSGGLNFNGGGLLVFDQPLTLADIPAMSGQNGDLRLLEDLDLDGADWTLPTVLNTVELGRFSQGGDQDVAVELANGRIAGTSSQKLIVQGRFTGDPVVLRDLILAIDLDLPDLYSLAHIQGNVTLDGATIHIFPGPNNGTVASLLRHGELQIGPGGQLLGQGSIEFTPHPAQTYRGGFTTDTDLLTITPGITVIGGEGRGLIGTDTGNTLNLGTLRAEARPDGFSALLIVGTGLDQQGTVEAEAGGWVEVQDAATLAGELVLDYTDATGLAEGDLLPILTAATITGSFDTLIAHLPSGFDNLDLGVALLYEAAGVSARITRLGDIDGDGFVGIGDLNSVLTHWNQDVTTAALGSGDLTADGFVGIDDLTEVLAHWNAGSLPPIASSAPEPSAATLLLGAGLALAQRRA